MTSFTLSNVRALIAEYAAAHPDGTDVIAFVLSQLGRESIEAHASAAKLSLSGASQEVGATVREMLVRKFPGSTRLEEVPVNPERWPALAGWVESYTAHRIAPRPDAADPAAEAAPPKKTL